MAAKDNPLKPKAKDNSDYADRRRAEKKQALREYIQGHHYIQAINNDLERVDITPEELPVIKFKTETRLRLLNKVLPDLKAVELSGEGGGAVLFQRIENVIVDPKSTNA